MSDIKVGSEWTRNNIDFEIINIKSIGSMKNLIEVSPIVGNCCTFTEPYFLEHFELKASE